VVNGDGAAGKDGGGGWQWLGWTHQEHGVVGSLMEGEKTKNRNHDEEFP